MKLKLTISAGQYGVMILFVAIAMNPFGEQYLLYQTVGRYSWLAILIAFFLSAGVLMLTTSLMLKFPGDNILTIVRRLFGKALSKLCAVLFVLIGVVWGAVMLMELWEMIHYTELKQTPAYAANLFVMAASVAMVWHGVESWARACQLLSLLLVFACLLLLTGLLQNADVTRLLPLNDPPWAAFMGLRVLSEIFLFKGTLVAFFLLPYVRNKEHITFWSLSSLACAYLFILIIITLPLTIFHVDAVKDWILPIQKSVGTVLLPFFPIHKISFLTAILWHVLILVNVGIILFCVTESLKVLIRIRKDKTLLLAGAFCIYALSLFHVPFIQVVRLQIYTTLAGVALYFGLPAAGSCMEWCRRRFHPR